MTDLEIQIQVEKALVSRLLRLALDAQAKDKGGFSIEQDKAWLAYDDALASLSKLYASKS
jgi:hypothetical protein